MHVRLTKSFHFEAAHDLPTFPADHKCRRLHGHSFRFDVIVAGEVDPAKGYLIDYGEIKRVTDPLVRQLDHYYLNEIEGLSNPTAENLSKWIWDRLKPSLPLLDCVVVHETCTSACEYRGERREPTIRIYRRENLMSYRRGAEIAEKTGKTPADIPVVFIEISMKNKIRDRFAAVRKDRTWLLFICSAVIVACVVASTLFIRSHRMTLSHDTCAKNLKNIGIALILYANANEGHYPDRLSQLLNSTGLTSNCFVCPMSNDTIAQGDRRESVAGELDTPGHNSYLYAGKGLNSSCPPNAVLVYEPLSNHWNMGMNVLWADGSVHFINRDDAIAMTRELAAGHNPP